MTTRISRRQFLGRGAGAAALVLSVRQPVHAQAGRKQLVYAKNEDIGQLNPYFVNHAVFETLDNQIQEPLVRFDYAKRVFEPVLAESWSSEEKGRRWVFKLRDGVRFHDGSPLTAEDVKYSFEAVAKEKTAFRQKANVVMIDKIIARDKLTVVCDCGDPVPGLLSYIQSRPPIMSRALGEKVGFDEAHKKMLGTGPYRFAEYARDERLVMEKNADYWGPKAKIDRIVYRPIPDPTARITALRAGQVDAVAQVPAFDVGKLEGSPDVRLYGVRAARIHMLFMNPIVPPLQKKQVRQAIHAGIDMDTILKTVLEGRGYRLSQMVGPTQVMTYDPDLKPVPHDPERAKKLLADAGYPNGVDIDFYDYASYNEYKPMAQAMAEQLGKVGVRLNVKSVESGVFRRMWFASEMPMYFISYGNVAEDASAFVQTYFRTGRDRRSKHSIPAADALFDQQEVENDPKKRQDLNRQLMRLLQEESPAVPLYNPQYTVGARKHVVIPPGIPTAGEYVWFGKMDLA
ncbi:MAG TPA: ABC transporter substrate-binding protein [Methylomirabilota bacterium]|nr:ABC transporter substrate-binding protein [Methylomirabilota bacterium]